MRRIFIIVLVVFNLQALIAQVDKKEFNYIICVDEEIIKVLQNPKIIIQKDNIIVKEIPLSYYPGKLTLNTEDYEYIYSLTQYEKLYIKFSYNDYSNKNKQEVFNYEIEIGKNWFDKSYLILKVYNTCKKQYKNKLEPLEGKRYTFDLETSNGQMIRIRKS